MNFLRCDILTKNLLDFLIKKMGENPALYGEWGANLWTGRTLYYPWRISFRSLKDMHYRGRVEVRVIPVEAIQKMDDDVSPFFLSVKKFIAESGWEIPKGMDIFMEEIQMAISDD